RLAAAFAQLRRRRKNALGEALLAWLDLVVLITPQKRRHAAALDTNRALLKLGLGSFVRLLAASSAR
ncbi:MAG: hypothetical protein WAN72_06070, partial [Candidatus Acidiferrales bacterium]